MVLYHLYVVRHGETEWNKEKRLQGHLDTALNATGLAQAAAVARALKDVNFIKAYSSDLQRASKTTEAILQYHPTLEVVLDEALRERVCNLYTTSLDGWLTPYHHKYMGELQGEFEGVEEVGPSLETVEALVHRCLSWYRRCIVQYVLELEKSDAAHDGSSGPPSILVVSHGGVITPLLRALLAEKALRFPRDLELVEHSPNTAVSIIDLTVHQVEDVRYLVGTMIKSSDVSHLEDMPRVDENEPLPMSSSQ